MCVFNPRCLKGLQPHYLFPPTFPKTHTSVVSRRGQQSASDVPTHTPHLGVMVVKLGNDQHLKLGWSRGGALFSVMGIMNKKICYRRTDPDCIFEVKRQHAKLTFPLIKIHSIFLQLSNLLGLRIEFLLKT